MKSHFLKLLLFLIIFASCGYIATASQQMLVDILVSKNDIVTENIGLKIVSNETYDVAAFTTISKPLSVIYDGGYSIKQEGNFYVIVLKKELIVGENSLNFTIIYNDLIDRKNKQRVFRTTFHPENNAEMSIRLTLPAHFVLSDKEPSAIPKPDLLTTDGQKITLIWDFNNSERADLSVFYEGEGNFGTIIIIFAVVLLAGISLIFFIFKKSKIRDIEETLSSEELKIVEQIRKGVTKQKEIAKNLEFSKSKMSKIVRKLEEKGLIEKKPYFKTNILKLSKKIR